MVHAADTAPEREAVEVTEGDHVRGALPLCLRVAPQPVHHGLHEQGERQAERVRERAREGYSITGAPEGAVGMAEVPEVPRGEAEVAHTPVGAVLECRRPIAGGVVEGNR